MNSPIHTLPLFASNLFETYVDPELYEKDKILSTIISNYEKQPGRNCWDNESSLHHYYDDWGNENFDPVNLDSLVSVYKNIFNNIITNIGSNIKYNFRILNITVSKDRDHYMKLHDHTNDGSILTTVHYLMCDKDSAALNIFNPNSFFIYPPSYADKNIELMDSNIFNSGYYYKWASTPVIDTMLIFPSYLKHEVTPSKNKTGKYRIAVVCNITLIAND
jgi:hypothetical protein